MKNFVRILDGVFLTLMACGCMFLTEKSLLIAYIPLTAVFLAINIFPSVCNAKIKSFRNRVCAEGADLLTSFLIAATLTTVFYIAELIVSGISVLWWISAGLAVLELAFVFWNGIIRVYCTSVQLGITNRVIGILCGPIPILHIWALWKIIRITSKEAWFEHDKYILNKQREIHQICKTKYPLLMVHGVFFRDYKYVNYWGRIPNELRKNGATVYFGNHQSALPVNLSGEELAQRIKNICEQTGCEKVNVIAHSKGGLDARYAVSRCGADKYVASVTTISTPNRGCVFVDWLLNKISKSVQNGIAATYNSALRKLGETPDFISAVQDLTYERCAELNIQMPDSDSVFYQSVGSKLNKAVSGKFPMNMSYHFVKHFSGDNDGLVSTDSFAHGKYTYLTVKGKRGISHADIVDMNRENIDGFDVREFYVQLVAELKQKGF